MQYILKIKKILNIFLFIKIVKRNIYLTFKNANNFYFI